MAELENQVALITGAASGIDLEIARVFYREGASVLLVDRNEDALRKAQAEFSPQRASFFAADVSCSDMVDAAVGEAVRKFGKLDILVNGAGLAYIKEIVETNDDAWRKVLSVMLDGVFYGIRAAARQMLKQGTGGKIISISSAASTVPIAKSVAYCTAKAGVNMITKVAAVELGQHKIRVNAIAPGETMTPMLQAYPYYDMPGWKELVVHETPLRRFGETRDMAEAALFLASNRSDWVTGEVLFVDGGQGMRGFDQDQVVSMMQKLMGGTP